MKTVYQVCVSSEEERYWPEGTPCSENDFIEMYKQKGVVDYDIDEYDTLEEAMTAYSQTTPIGSAEGRAWDSRSEKYRFRRIEYEIVSLHRAVIDEDSDCYDEVELLEQKAPSFDGYSARF